MSGEAMFAIGILTFFLMLFVALAIIVLSDNRHEERMAALGYVWDPDKRQYVDSLGQKTFAEEYDKKV